MEPNPPGRRGRFATTRWSMVLAARDRHSPQSRRALSELCEAYWYPLYAFARRRGLDPDAAQDATQGFFARFLERNALQHVDPARGRFRAFLLTSFRNHLEDERLKSGAQKRGGGQPVVSIDAEDAERRYAHEPSHTQTPERLFERRWAVTVLENALSRLSEKYAGGDRRRMFEHLKGHLVAGGAEQSQAEIARELGMNEVSVRVAVHRLRRRYRQALLDEIAETLGSEEDLPSELDHLFAALESAPPPV